MQNVEKLQDIRVAKLYKLVTYNLCVCVCVCVCACQFHRNAANCQRWPTYRGGQLQGFYSTDLTDSNISSRLPALFIYYPNDKGNTHLWNIGESFDPCILILQQLVKKLSDYTPRRRSGQRRYSCYSFSTSALDGGESVSRPGRALGERTPQYALYRKLGGPQSQLSRASNLYCPVV
jgi:hypothetical protein